MESCKLRYFNWFEFFDHTGLIRTEFSVGTTTGIVRTDFRPVLYICALHAHAGIALSGVFLLYRVDNRIHTYSTKNRPFWTLAEVLANYT